MRKLADRRYTAASFRRDFPDDAACLEWLRGHLYPNGIFCKACKRTTKHHRVRARRSYSCDRCGHHVFPATGTIFERSRTPLRVWFHAVYVTASRPRGISAKQLQKGIGVTYKTAWRMLRQIRTLLGRGEALGAGGKRAGATAARVVRTQRQEQRVPAETNKASRIAGPIQRRRVNAARRAAWLQWKGWIRGVYHAVSRKYLHTYLNECSFRHRQRRNRTPMFTVFLRQI